MSNMGISTDPALLGVALADSLTESPSVTTFLPEEDASTCPLLPSTPSPPPMAFSHPLTPSADNESNNSINGEDTKAETSSSGSSSGIAMDVADTATAALFNSHAYQHLGKKQENSLQFDQTTDELSPNLNYLANGTADLRIYLKTRDNESWERLPTQGGSAGPRHWPIYIFSQENGIKQNGLMDISITKNTPCFVSWNWPLIRKCTFFVFMSSLLAMCAVVIAMIVTLPKTCNPKTTWYRGSVFYEIFPASFQDSNGDGVGDLRGITSRLDYLESMGIRAIRLNSIFPSKDYPDHYQNITSLTSIDEVLGTVGDLHQLAFALHEKNMSLVLDMPIFPFLKQLDVSEALNVSDNENSTGTTILKTPQNVNAVTDAMRLWLTQGVDGFYVKGLEMFANDPYLLENIAEWKYALGHDRVLIVSEHLFDNVHPDVAKQIAQNVDLIDVHLDISNGTASMTKQIKSTLSGVLAPSEDGPWVQWALGGVMKRRISKDLSPNSTMAATIMQLMLPGTPNIFYGDEISLEESHDPHDEHVDTKHLHHLSAMAWSGGVQFTVREQLPWLPHGATATFENYEKISSMIRLRDQSPSIYKNSIFREEQSLPNTNVRHSKDDILIVERTYPRRNTFVSVSNFGTKPVAMDLSSLYYSGLVMLGSEQEKIFFSEFQIGPLQTIVVRLDK